MNHASPLWVLCSPVPASQLPLSLFIHTDSIFPYSPITSRSPPDFHTWMPLLTFLFFFLPSHRITNKADTVPLTYKCKASSAGRKKKNHPFHLRQNNNNAIQMAVLWPLPGFLHCFPFFQFRIASRLRILFACILGQGVSVFLAYFFLCNYSLSPLLLFPVPR